MSAGLYVIGLTGNIATGKSAVAAILAELGARVIDADALAHEVVKAGTPVWQRVVDEFGQDVLQPGGEIDRAKLAALVFSNPVALARLEAITHPAVIAECERLLQESQTAERASGATSLQVIVIEAIKLIESGLSERCDELWVVTAPHEQQMQRLTERRGLSAAEAELRMHAQPPQADKVAQADVVIDNSGALAQTRAQVQKEWERILTAQHSGQSLTSKPAKGGSMSSLRQWVEQHPFLSMWAVLAVGMVAIFWVASRDVELLLSQRLFMAAACVGLAGLCTWIISWES